MSIMDDYRIIPIAKPGVYDWKKELDNKRATLARNAVIKKIPRQDGEMDKYGDLVIGEGIKQVL